MPRRSAPPPPRAPWLRELAAGYLTEFPRVSAERRGGLRGFRFTRRVGRSRAGFFVGFLTRRSRDLPFALGPPECAVFAFVEPLRGSLHARLVRSADALFPVSYGFITKYTARQPRFELHEERSAALIRHVPLRAFPPGAREKHARNFFMETLAILQRSALVERLARL